MTTDGASGVAGEILARLDAMEAAAKAAIKGFELMDHKPTGLTVLGGVVYNPAETLRLVTGLRAVVAEHPPHIDHRPIGNIRFALPAVAETTFCETCGDPYFWDQTPPVVWPCPTLLAIAAGLGWEGE